MLFTPKTTPAAVEYDAGTLIGHVPQCAFPRGFAIVVTIGKYSNGHEIQSGQRQPRAREITDYLVRGGGMPLENVVALDNEEATRSNILSALQQVAVSAPEDANLLIYFDCHGLEVSSGPGSGYYLCPYDYSGFDRGNTGLHSSELVKALRRMRCRNVLTVMLTCHPGIDPATCLDTEAAPPLGSYHRERLLSEFSNWRGRALFVNAKEEEPMYTGVFANHFVTAITAGFLAPPKEQKDAEDTAIVRFREVVQRQKSELRVFPLRELLRRLTVRDMPAEYSRCGALQLEYQHGNNSRASARAGYTPHFLSTAKTIL